MSARFDRLRTQRLLGTKPTTSAVRQSPKQTNLNTHLDQLVILQHSPNLNFKWASNHAYRTRSFLCFRDSMCFNDEPAVKASNEDCDVESDEEQIRVSELRMKQFLIDELENRKRSTSD